MRKITKSILPVFLTMCFLLIAPINVFADSATGSTTYVTVYGYNYHHYSSVLSDSTSAWSYVHPNCSVNAPTGYMGGYPRLYNSNYSLVKAGTWTYNENPSSAMGLSTGKYVGTGTYYGKGQVRYYNGNGYSEYTTTSTPFVQVRSLQNIPAYANYRVNVNGQTYGSDYFAEYKGGLPDLISAIGNNGISGYVKAIDLEQPMPKTPEEALAYMEIDIVITTIPLYDSDGITIIDTFSITPTIIE